MAAPTLIDSATIIVGYGDIYRQGVADWSAIIDRVAMPAFNACWHCRRRPHRRGPFAASYELFDKSVAILRCRSRDFLEMLPRPTSGGSPVGLSATLAKPAAADDYAGISCPTEPATTPTPIAEWAFGNVIITPRANAILSERKQIHC